MERVSDRSDAVGRSEQLAPFVEFERNLISEFFWRVSDWAEAKGNMGSIISGSASISMMCRYSRETIVFTRQHARAQYLVVSHGYYRLTCPPVNISSNCRVDFRC